MVTSLPVSTFSRRALPDLTTMLPPATVSMMMLLVSAACRRGCKTQLKGTRGVLSTRILSFTPSSTSVTSSV